MGRSNPDSLLNNSSQACQQAAEIQQETLEAVQRIQLRAAETEAVGITSLAELQAHREKVETILSAGDRLHEQLDTAETLQNRFGRWNLQFNRRAAKRDTKQELKALEKKELAKEERSLRISMASSDAINKNGSLTSSASSSLSSTPTSTPVRVKHTSSLVKSRPKKKQPVGDSGPKGLLYGLDPTGHENEQELRELAGTDQIIDKELDKVSSQLDGLLNMTKTMKTEIATQDVAMEEVSKTLVKADYKAKVVNDRGRRFLTGKPRRELDKSRVLGLDVFTGP